MALNKDVETNIDWKNLLEITKLIKNKDIREFTVRMLKEEVPDYFAKIAASATGKYHPANSLGYGGLLRHTLAVAVIVNDISSLAYLKLTRIDRDYLIAASILHDTFKQGDVESGNTIRTHPEVAAKHILKKGMDWQKQEISKIIAGLVIAHMGEWGNHKPGNRGQFLVHLADFIASRKNVIITWDSVISQLGVTNG